MNIYDVIAYCASSTSCALTSSLSSHATVSVFSSHIRRYHHQQGRRFVSYGGRQRCLVSIEFRTSSAMYNVPTLLRAFGVVNRLKTFELALRDRWKLSDRIVVGIHGHRVVVVFTTQGFIMEHTHTQTSRTVSPIYRIKPALPFVFIRTCAVTDTR